MKPVVWYNSTLDGYVYVMAKCFIITKTEFLSILSFNEFCFKLPFLLTITTLFMYDSGLVDSQVMVSNLKGSKTKILLLGRDYVQKEMRKSMFNCRPGASFNRI